MRILILANDGGGLYSFRKELLESIIKDGHRVHVSFPNGNYVSKISNLGCKYIECSYLERHGKNPLKDLALLFHYLKVLDNVKPDIVLSYTIKPNIYGGMACRLKRIPYITNITGLGNSIQNGGILQKLALVLYKCGIRSALKVFFQNTANKDFMAKHGIVKNTETLPGSGVNLEQHCFEEYPEDDRKIIFTTIGRIMRDKGINEILSAAEIIRKKYPFVHFRLIGGFDEAYQDIVERAVRDEIIEYIQEQTDIHPFIKESHAIVHASYHEGMSNVLLESAATGRPVIATNIPGCQETYEEGVSGIGFLPRNTKDLVRALEEFINLPYEKKTEMGIAGRRKMEREFDRQIVIKRYLEEINKIKGRRDMNNGTI